jgi:hypothetical protein
VTPRRKPTLAEVALAVGALLIAASWYGRGDYDFHAFYCAGRALNHHIDPYRFAYLARCEGQLHAIPAPLPGYDLALFGLLARLPFPWANALYLAASTAAVALAAVCLRRLTRLSPVLIVTTLFVSDFFASIHSGQIVSFAVVCIAGAAYLAESGRPNMAGLVVLGTLVEPHVGIGACVAFALAARASRLVMACSVALVALLSVGTTGWQLALEYFTTVLPRHAASEIGHQSQLSFTHVMHLAGFSDRIALIAGSLSFAATLAAGVWLGLALARRTGSPAFAVVIPPAFSLIGGTYIHANQMCLALPAALLLYARFPARRPQTAFAIALLAIPWSEATIVADQPVAVVLTLAVLGFCLGGGSLRTTAAGAVAAALVLFVCDVLIGPQDAATVLAFRPELGSGGFVDDEWRQFVAVEFVDHPALYFALGTLTWLGLALLAYTSTRAARAEHLLLHNPAKP